MHELVHEAVNNLAPLIQERKALITLELNAEHPFLLANKDYLIIVIVNLLDNAIKYSKEPSITIATKNADNRIIVFCKR